MPVYVCLDVGLTAVANLHSKSVADFVERVFLVESGLDDVQEFPSNICLDITAPGRVDQY